jgi:Flp pilus assembly pilin Flp
VEYGLILALVAVVVVGILFAIGQGLAGKFGTVRTAIENPQSLQGN